MSSFSENAELSAERRKVENPSRGMDVAGVFEDDSVGAGAAGGASAAVPAFCSADGVDAYFANIVLSSSWLSLDWNQNKY